MTQLSDEILIAYGDGELGEAQIRAVNSVLTADPETLARLHLLQPSRQRLGQAFQSMLLAEKRERAFSHASGTANAASSAAPLTMPTPPVEAVLPSRRSPLMSLMMVGMLLLVVGGTGGYLAGRTPQKSSADVAGDFWDEKAVQAEKKKTEELIGRIPGGNTTAAIVRRDDGGAGLAWYELVAKQHEADAEGWLERLDGGPRNPDLALFEVAKSGVAPDLIPELNREELLFIGADIVSVGGAKYARLAYRDLSQGAVGVGLYVGAVNGSTQTMERGSLGGLNYVRWGQGARSYELIAAIPHWRLFVVAAAVKKQLTH